ncbi:MAG: hypothetical protein IH614_09260 [Desulfuromonadales bacterium]|nr:hypothetical protein [Desulfuromonadales bacterium]
MSSTFRATAFLLLLFVSLSLSGFALAATTVAHPEVADACCGGQEQQESQPAPCATFDCPCFSCLTLELAEPLALLAPADSPVTVSATPYPPPRGEYLRAIDYPPEAI